MMRTRLCARGPVGLLLALMLLSGVSYRGAEGQQAGNGTGSGSAVTVGAATSAGAQARRRSQTNALADPDGEAGHQVGADIVDIYETAVAHLENVCEDYRRIKAIQLAQVRDIPFDTAYENISSVMPALAEINKTLLRKSIRRSEDIQGHKEEVELVKKEIEMMIDLTTKLLDAIEQIKTELLEMAQPLPELTLEEIVQRPEFDPEAVPRNVEPRAGEATFEALVEMARDDETERAKDLTTIMRHLLDIRDLTRDQRDQEQQIPDIFKSSDDTGLLQAVIADDIHKTFGRRITTAGIPAEWMFVDTWYTIGPFPNPSRRNINRKFPPETVIDLDAAYAGKDERLVRWQWVQSHASEVIPADPEEYAIYYAYTEVFCDRPMDLWVAVGSDDKADVWLNGMPIWVSSEKLKGWRMDEGFRKVAFNAGVNTVLYRIENGWLHVGFSMAIRVAP